MRSRICLQLQALAERQLDDTTKTSSQSPLRERAKFGVRIDVPSHTNICSFLHHVMGGGENLTRTSMNARVRLKRGYLTQLIIAATHPDGSKLLVSTALRLPSFGRLR